MARILSARPAGRNAAPKIHPTAGSAVASTSHARYAPSATMPTDQASHRFRNASSTRAAVEANAGKITSDKRPVGTRRMPTTRVARLYHPVSVIRPKAPRSTESMFM